MNDGWRVSQRGASLIELLITIIIGVIALMALAVPFVAERSFESSGKRQTEAQRDAQMALRSMTKAARDSSSYFVTAGASSTRIDFARPCGTMSFEGGPNFSGGQIWWVNGCVAPVDTTVLIDGIRSRVTNFTVTPVTTRLVKLRLDVIHENLRSEFLETEIFLRNAA